MHTKSRQEFALPVLACLAVAAFAIASLPRPAFATDMIECRCLTEAPGGCVCSPGKNYKINPGDTRSFQGSCPVEGETIRGLEVIEPQIPLTQGTLSCDGSGGDDFANPENSWIKKDCTNTTTDVPYSVTVKVTCAAVP